MERFFYSKKQEQIIGADLVKVNDKWEKFNCWTEGEPSNRFDDWVLVYETDDIPEVVISSSKVSDIGIGVFMTIIDTILDFYLNQIASKPNKKNSPEQPCSFHARIDELRSLIDKALETDDKESFNKYSKEYALLKLEL